MSASCLSFTGPRVFPLFFRCRFVRRIMASSASEAGDLGAAQSQSPRPRGAEVSVDVFSQLALGTQQDGGHVGLTQQASAPTGSVVSSGGAFTAGSSLPGPSQMVSSQVSESFLARPAFRQASTSGTFVSPALSSAPVSQLLRLLQHPMLGAACLLIFLMVSVVRSLQRGVSFTLGVILRPFLRNGLVLRVITLRLLLSFLGVFRLRW